MIKPNITGEQKISMFSDKAKKEDEEIKEYYKPKEIDIEINV